MNLKTPLLAMTLAASALLAFNASAHEPKGQDMKGHDMPKMPGHDMKAPSAGSMEMHKIMMTGMKMPMKMTGSVDRDFAQMMIMHHQQALKMADVEIAKGSKPELKALAQKMKAAQQDEIKKLQRFTK